MTKVPGVVLAARFGITAFGAACVAVLALVFAGAAKAQSIPVVNSVSPPAGSHAAAPDADVTADLGMAMNTPTSAEFRVHTNQRGWLTGTRGGTATGVEFDPAGDLLPGEEITAILTDGLTSAQSTPIADSHAWAFRGAPAAKPASFGSYSMQLHTNNYANGWEVHCGDFDSDGDLDLVVARHGDQSAVYFNDGTGSFPSVFNLGAGNELYYDFVTGDFDEDGDLDIAAGSHSGQDVLYLNNGSGDFTNTATFGPTDSMTYCLDVADFNGDGHLDIVSGHGTTSGVANTIYLGDGTGAFPNTKLIEIVAGSSVGVSDCTLDVAVGDMNGDGHCDIITCEFAIGTGYASRVYFNDGDAGFNMYDYSSSTPVQNYADIGTSKYTQCIDVGDIDNDGDLDVVMGTNGGTFAANGYGFTYVGTNDGSGSFTEAYISFASENTWDVELADFDGDGDLDLLIVHDSGTNRVVLNDGSGLFTTTQSLNASTNIYGIGTGDIDGDGDIDAVSPEWVYYNGGHPPAINVQISGSWLNNNDTLNVAYGTDVSTLAPMINVYDFNYDLVTLTLSASNAPGITTSEWEMMQGQTPYNLYPTSGTFNQSATNHTFTLTADDGTNTTTFTFHVDVGAQPAPSIEVYETTTGGVVIANGATANGLRDFGSQLIGAGPTQALVVAIHNSGNANLNLGGISLSGADAAEFVLDLNGTASVVAPGSSTTFAVQFDPNTAGAKSAAVEVVHNDSSTTTPFTFSIAGIATTPAPAPIIAVKEGSLQIANGMGAAAGRNFGSRDLGDASAPVIITVMNAGNTDLLLGTPTATGNGASEFSVDALGFPAVVPAGQMASFSITYLATTPGLQGAMIEFTHNDSSTSTPFTFGVVGVATATAGSGGNAGGSDGSGGGCAAGPTNSTAFLLLAIIGVALARRQLRF